MYQQQISELQKRLQSRKDQGRGFRIKTFSSSSQMNSIMSDNPQTKKKILGGPGKFYSRQLNAKNRSNPVTIDHQIDQMAEIYPIEKQIEQGYPKKHLKLPLLRQKNNKLTKYYRPRIKTQSHQYRQPTYSSQHYSKQNQSTARKFKRICSVDCQSRQSNHQIPKINNSKSRKRLIKIDQEKIKYKIKEVKENKRQKIKKQELEESFESQTQNKYPVSHLQKYISNAKFSEEPEYSNTQNQHYETYFGMQPEFYYLQTQYAKQIYTIPQIKYDEITQARPHQIPEIPNQRRLGQFIQKYQCFSPQISMEKLMYQENFFIEYSSHEVYFGQMNEQNRQGMGILIGQRFFFEGLFKNNSKYRGIEVTPSGIYKGQFYNDKKQGKGEFQWINGEAYIGDWKEGHRHGSGVWTNKKGESYNGQWFKGKGKGMGTYLSEGKQYCGDFYEFKKDGWGRERFQNGDVFEGGFKKGIPEGRGTYIWSNGTKYEGYFNRGLRTGKGILSTLDGFTYNGQFRNEKPEGLCSLSMPNGDVYEGYLRKGKKNGQGVLKLSKQKVRLQGFWKDDHLISKSFH